MYPVRTATFTVQRETSDIVVTIFFHRKQSLLNTVFIVATLIALANVAHFVAYACGCNAYSIDLERSSSQYLSIADASQTGLDFTSSYTLEAWVKIESAPASGEKYGIVAKHLDSDKGYRMYYENSAGTLKLTGVASKNNSANSSYSVAQDLGTGTWHHVAFTIDTSVNPARGTLYVDGSSVLTDTDSDANTTQNNGQPLIIGALPTTSTTNYFDGLIDDVRIWSTVRTATEIVNNMSVTLVGNESGLVGYWKFDADALDTTSNHNDLNAGNSPIYITDVPPSLQSSSCPFLSQPDSNIQVTTCNSGAINNSTVSQSSTGGNVAGGSRGGDGEAGGAISSTGGFNNASAVGGNGGAGGVGGRGSAVRTGAATSIASTTNDLNRTTVIIRR